MPGLTAMRPGVTTIPDVLRAAAAEGVGAYVFHLEDGPISVASAELAERAERAARRLIAQGVEPGDTVGVLGPNRPEWLVAAHAIWMAGATLVPGQIPLRINDPDAFSEQQRRLVEAAGCRLVLADPLLLPFLPDGYGVEWGEGGEASGEEPAGPAAGDVAVIQFTSGSTAMPKGVLIGHDAVVAQLNLLYDHYYYEGVRHSTVSWAPFFHDLGLIASVVLPPFTRSTVELLPTELFARDPASWLRLIEATRGVGTLGPSTAFGSALRAARRRGERPDLSSLDVAHFAAEGVDPDVAMRLGEEGRDFGLRPEALGSTYGLAEAVLGVAYSAKGGGMRVDRISLDGLARAGEAVPSDTGATRAMVSCGRPVMELRIADADGAALPARRVGQILVRGRSLTSGYVGDSVPSPFDAEGWLHTGDMGYLADGELYVAGRAKDMLIVMGQNYYPEDFEWAAGRVEGVRPGRCMAFSRPDGGEGIALLVEPSDPAADSAALAKTVTGAVRAAIGVAPDEVLVARRGALEKTTSGKLRHAAMRQAYASGRIPAATPPSG